ncbi:MAG TPA: class I SAM-dependent methyltransferase, partial [bacterium]|nr:class I SAM-dependent methyltransferase [bacterium]
ETLAESIADLRAGVSNLHSVERRNLGDLSQWCHSAIHLQCASGHDTLSLVLEGVQHVTGIDISDVHIENAHRLSRETGMAAEWIRCDVLDTPGELNGSADLVYTGRGAMCWIQDLTAWAAVVARLLRPGGVFHVLDDHPVTWLFRQDTSDLQASGVDYLDHWESNKGWSESYLGNLGKPVSEEARKYEKLWPLGRIVQALIDAGLRIEQVGEHPEPYWDSMPELKEEYRRLLPMTFSVKARKPMD